ncbi:hypothetical protein SAMN02910293_01195 [Streptococcus henryi]|uniref:Uncharacterized protein n=1 Tax=Streptococcus henryi TaxID=439219 RepID=A0A1G6BSY9_9STRE|nr:hypothetical protein SAMN02910293_01195 [Streptococcus henryi]
MNRNDNRYRNGLLIMSRKKFLLILLSVSVAVTAVGIGFSIYNYYIFYKPFINSTTMGLLSAFVMSTAMIIIGLSKTE